MRTQINLYQNGTWQKELDTSLDSENTLINIFSNDDFKSNEKGFQEIFDKFPKAIITGCSTTGEIYQGELHDGTLSVAITKFEKTKIVAKYVKVEKLEESFEKGSNLAKQFDQKGLKALFVLSEGITVEGSGLVAGINSVLNRSIAVTGGLASDNGKLKETWVLMNRKAAPNYVSAIGFYGENFNIDYASEGGWNKYGMERIITSCDEKTNTIYTVDDKPILKLYKHYMGEHANNLPISALQFPFLVIDEENDKKIRTLYSVDEETQSIRVYGDIKEGDKIIFLKGSPSYIIAGAQKAAQNLRYTLESPVLALSISCMGRRAVLKEQTEDEIEALEEVFKSNVSQVGFYSYGEISPQASGKCGLLNQTMTVTLMWES
ncbi:MAG: Unknown protein [uncultured Sulfurovum sp.]|uniref:Uncharacterized protein n=1 Tax=uncultured Sulfurovum sp. TaxID=269237 RepID=A0A6S6SCQ0_9BACT|nr:MAG: Unknown protein [uncultured Sulfurovum sp.]